MPSSTVDAVSGTYVVEDRGRHFYDMVSLGSPRSVGGQFSERGRRPGKQLDRLKHTELPALASLDQLLARTRFLSDLDTQQAKDVPLKLPPIHVDRSRDLHERSGDFKEWLRHPRARPRKSSIDEEGERPPVSWHLLLLRASYNDKSLQAATVADWLVEVLDISRDLAQKSAEAAKVRPAVHLATFPAWREVTEKADSLRALGLAVQVGSTGMHGAIVGNKRATSGGPMPKATYLDLFTGLALAKRKRRSQPRPPGSKSQDQRKVWRGITQKVVVNVLSKDPVQALFKEESGSPEAGGPWNGESDAERSLWDAATLRRKQLKKILLRYKHSVEEAAAGQEPPSVSKMSSARPAPPSRNGSKSHIERVVRLHPHRKEACQMMRFFVFGLAGLSTKRETLTADSMGTRSQVETLCKMWLKLDNDHSGRCDFTEFRPFAEARMADLAKGLLSAQLDGSRSDVPDWATMSSEEDIPRVVSRFLKTLEQVLLGVKSSFTVEDMMRVLWPAAQLSSLVEMRRWGTELSRSLDRTIVSTPPLLPEAQLEDLQCVFKYFDINHDGNLKASEILATGILNPAEVKFMMEQYDVDGDGTLGILEFCEMLCPHGFRAHDKATRAHLQDGTQVVYDPTIRSWQMQPK